MSYKVKLEIFEGPLDLLLYLIKKEELNIYDIPIAKITSQYLEYLNLMQLLDLKLAGEFLVMASTLMQIKSRLLLPVEEQEQEEEQLDPRSELVARLLEYQKFKQAAARLENLETEQGEIFRRGVSLGSLEEEQQQEEDYFEASLFDLISAFSKILKTVPKEEFLEIIKEEFTVEKKIHDLLHLLVVQPEIYFSELFKKAKTKVEIIAIFLAVLELIRLKEITVKQNSSFADIQIVRHPEHIKVKGGR